VQSRDNGSSHERASNWRTYTMACNGYTPCTSVKKKVPLSEMIGYPNRKTRDWVFTVK
jgi:hypothetical protein